MKKVLISVAVVIILVLSLLGYWGFLPWFSQVLGSDKPVELGVKASADDLAQGVDKLNFLTVQSGSQKTGVIDLSGNEISALVNSGYWATLPVKEVQVRLNQDGTAEASGMVQADQVGLFAASQGLPADAANRAMQRFNMDRNMPFYFKGRLSVINNQVGLSVDSLEIGRFPLKGLIDQYQTEINTLGTVNLGQHGYEVKSLSIEGGKLVLDATVPLDNGQ